jgi:hypothetical protein
LAAIPRPCVGLGIEDEWENEDEDEVETAKCRHGTVAVQDGVGHI